jgi:hypothetical protein
MSTALQPAPTASRPVRARRGPRWNRIVIGLLLAAGGIGWLLDIAGVRVPWHLAPAAALILIGVAMLASLAGGTGRVDLVVMGAVALVLAGAVGIGLHNYAGPIGDRTIVPARDGWPQPVRIAAGTVVLDLTQGPLPAGGIDLALGAGEVDVLLPADQPVRVDARVVAGVVVVDGQEIGQGMDLRWSEQATQTPVTVVVDLGAGEVEIDHVPA